MKLQIHVLFILTFCLLVIDPALTIPESLVTVDDFSSDSTQEQVSKNIVYTSYLDIRVKTPVLDNMLTRVEKLERKSNELESEAKREVAQLQGEVKGLKIYLENKAVEELKEMANTLESSSRLQLETMKTNLENETREMLYRMKTELQDVSKAQLRSMEDGIKAETGDQITSLLTNLSDRGNDDIEEIKNNLQSSGESKIGEIIIDLSTVKDELSKLQSAVNLEIEASRNKLRDMTNQLNTLASSRHTETGVISFRYDSNTWPQDTSVKKYTVRHKIISHKFKTPYKEVPAFHYGVIHEDLFRGQNTRYSVSLQSLDKEGFTLRCHTWSGSTVYVIMVNWISLVK